MSTTTPPASAAELCAAFAANYTAETQAKVDPPRFLVHDDPCCTWFSSDLAAPKLNMVLQTALTEGTVAAQVARVSGHFRAAALPFCWRVFPHSQPASLAAHLSAAGLVSRPYIAAVMAVACADLPDDLLTPPGLRIVEVEEAAGIAAFYRVLAPSFDTPPTLEAFYTASYTRLGSGANRHFLAYLDGVAVATTSLYLDGGLAGIYKVSTLAAARGRGIGAAITVAACRAAQAVGYQQAALFASAMGEPVYMRLGFRTVGRMATYLCAAAG